METDFIVHSLYEEVEIASKKVIKTYQNLS